MPFTWKRAAQYELGFVRTRREAPMLGRDVKAIRAVGPTDQSYQPLTEAPQLFREFAGLSLTEETCLDFAQRYGLLGLPSITYDENERVEALELFGWSEEQTAVWQVVSAWDVLNGDEDVDVLVEQALTGEAGTTREKRMRLAAKIATAINVARKQHHLTPQLQVQRIESIESIEFIDDYEPTTLIGAIWTQVIQAVTQRKDHLPCANQCGRWVERSPLKRGPKARFCGDSCRAAFDQRAVARAKQLLREKKSIKAIVAGTGLTRDRVKRILETEKQKGGR